MAFLSGLTANGLLESLTRLGGGGMPGIAPMPTGAPKFSPRDTGILDLLHNAMDPRRLAISQALLAGDHDVVSRLTEPLRRQRLARQGMAERPELPLSAGYVSPASEVSAALPPFDHPDALAPTTMPSSRPIHLAGLQSNVALMRQTMTQPEEPPSRGIVDVAIDQGLQLAEEAWDRDARRIKGINGFGYVPQKSDYDLLARALFAEARNTPDDMEAIAHVMLNRIRPMNSPRQGRELGRTLEEVLSASGQFSFWPNRRQPQGSDSWVLSAHPERMNQQDRRSWERAVKIAELALREKSSDPTDGASFFFASQDYDGRTENAGSAPTTFFQQGIANGSMIPAPYRSPYETRSYPPTNFFFRYRGDQGPAK